MGVARKATDQPGRFKKAIYRDVFFSIYTCLHLFTLYSCYNNYTINLLFLSNRSKILFFRCGTYTTGAGLSSSPPDFNGNENIAFSAMKSLWTSVAALCLEASLTGNLYPPYFHPPVQNNDTPHDMYYHFTCLHINLSLFQGICRSAFIAKLCSTLI